MKTFVIIFSVIILGSVVAGCSGDSVQTIDKPATAVDPPKNSSNWAIKNNPNIPDAAKKAMLGQQGGPK